MNRVYRDILLGIVAMALLAFSPVVARAKEDKDKKTDGSYTVSVAGFAKGEGQATASGSTVSVTATVTDEEGNKGTLTASGLTVDAKKHVTGSGTVLGQSMTLSGRLDPVTDKDNSLKTQRLVLTFKTAGGAHGRIVGYISVANGGGKNVPPAGGGGSGGGDDGGGGGTKDGPPPPKSGGGGRGPGHDHRRDHRER
jgi:hypothetical protein